MSHCRWQFLVDLKNAKLNKLVFRWESTSISQDNGLDWKLENHLEEGSGNLLSCLETKGHMMEIGVEYMLYLRMLFCFCASKSVLIPV